MAAKKKPTTEAAIKTEALLSDEEFAKSLLMPSLQATLTINTWQPQAEPNPLFKELSLQIDNVNNGDMKRPEAMLLAQAHTLDQLFNHLARRAYQRETVSSCEIHLRLAFKAQAQCRSTLETLSNIKNPPVVFAKQANFSGGHQQINNVPAQASHPEETKNQQNELLVEAQYGSTALDINTTGAAIPVNSELEALE